MLSDCYFVDDCITAILADVASVRAGDMFDVLIMCQACDKCGDLSTPH